MIDLYGGSVEIYFQSKDGEHRNVTNIALGVTTGGNKQFPNFVESVKVKTSIISFTEIEVTFSPPFDQAVNMINSGVLGLGFQGPASGAALSSALNSVSAAGSSFDFNTVSVRLHYGGRVSPWFKGILMAPNISIASEDISITIKAVGILFQATKTSEKEIFPSSTRKQILEKVSASVSKMATIIYNPSDGVAIKSLATLEKYNHSDSDWRAFKEILTKSNCVIIDKGMSGPGGKPTYEIVSKDYLRRQNKGVPTFVIREQIDPNRNIFPILSMDTSINNVLLGQTIGIQSTIFDKTDKTQQSATQAGVGSETVKDFTGVRSSADGSQGGGASDGDLKKKRLPILSPNKTIKDNLTGLVQEFTDSPLQYTIKTVGIVDLLPGTPANISVPKAKFLSSTYDLYTVEHTFVKGGVETLCTLARTYGLAGMATEGIDKLKSIKTNITSGNVKSSVPGAGIIPK